MKKNCTWCGGSGCIDYGSEILPCELCDGTGDFKEESYTCHKCRDKETCRYAFDAYNTGGDCLASK